MFQCNFQPRQKKLRLVRSHYKQALLLQKEHRTTITTNTYQINLVSISSTTTKSQSLAKVQIIDQSAFYTPFKMRQRLISRYQMSQHRHLFRLLTSSKKTINIKHSKLKLKIFSMTSTQLRIFRTLMSLEKRIKYRLWTLIQINKIWTQRAIIFSGVTHSINSLWTQIRISPKKHSKKS